MKLTSFQVESGLELATNGLAYVAIFSLFFSFTNFLFLSAIFSGIALILSPLVILQGLAKHKSLAIFFIGFIYFFVVALLYDPSAFIDFDFYRRDGNLFISFAPLMALPLFQSLGEKFWKTESLIKGLIIISLFTNIPLLIYWLATGNLYTPENGLAEAGYFSALFLSTNAAGGFFAVLLSLSTVYLFQPKERWWGIVSCLMLGFMLYETSSRGSLYGWFLAVLLCVLFKRWQFRFFSIMLPGLAVILLFAGAVLSLEQPREAKAYDEALAQGQLSFGADIGEKEANWQIRTQVLWPRALDLALQSPLFGIGFGAYDDRPVELEEYIPGLTSFNKNGDHIHSDAHAHNSYLHMFAECGVIGLSIFLGMLYSVLMTISKISNSRLCFGLTLAFWTLTFASLSEHRWVSPSNALPFFLILLLALIENGEVAQVTHEEL
ncbi:MAG: O-antigen ligase family protein [Anaerolineae bacterium]|nr:O-antigen ligase family protein [Gloeobacterales cyanobacterium ES-bin-313]